MGRRLLLFKIYSHSQKKSNILKMCQSISNLKNGDSSD